MTLTTFDTHDAVKRLCAAGIDDAQAETLVAVIGHAIGEPVTRSDLEPLATKEFVRTEISRVELKISSVDMKTAGLRAEIAGLEARLFRHLWVMAAGIVGATFTLLKLFP